MPVNPIQPVKAVKAMQGAEATAKALKAGENAVDVSKGFNIKVPKEVALPSYIQNQRIPFKPNTDIEKARTWTKNFLRPAEDFTDEVQKFTVGPGKFETKGELKYKANGDAFINYDVTDEAYIIRFTQAGKEKGTGIGAGMYRTLFEKAQKEGKIVRSDSTMSDSSVALWRRFKELGYPIVEKPYKKSESGGSFGKYVPTEGGDAAIFEFRPPK